jgi:hypothetical protein
VSSHMAVSQFSSKQRIALVALTVVAAFSALVSGWWHYSVMARRVDIVEANSETEMDLGKLSSVPLYDVDGRTTVELKGSEDGPKRLLVFLTAADCSRCLDELGDWVSIARATPSKRFEVDLIYVNTASNELASFATNNPLPYHSYLDESGELLKNMKVPPETPVTVLVDKHFRILAAQAPEPDRNIRQPFVAKVEALVSRSD